MKTIIKILLCVIGYVTVRHFVPDTFLAGWITGLVAMTILRLMDSGDALMRKETIRMAKPSESEATTREVPQCAECRGIGMTLPCPECGKYNTVPALVTDGAVLPASLTLVTQTNAPDGTGFMLVEDAEGQYVYTWRNDDADTQAVFSECMVGSPTRNLVTLFGRSTITCSQDAAGKCAECGHSDPLDGQGRCTHADMGHGDNMDIDICGHVCSEVAAPATHDHAVECYTVSGVLDCEIDNPPATAAEPETCCPYHAGGGFPYSPCEPVPAPPVGDEVACPFKVGDRVRYKKEIRGSCPEATVTKLTERGFCYEYDEPFLLGTRIGSTTGGEAFENSFSLWELVAPASAPQRIHISVVPFIAICGADNVGLRTTQIPMNATCDACVHFWGDFTSRADIAVSRAEPHRCPHFEPKGEDSGGAYNAKIIAEVTNDLLDPWEHERISGTRWYQLRITDLIQRIANLRVMLAAAASPVAASTAQGETCKWSWNGRKEFWASECGYGLDVSKDYFKHNGKHAMKFCGFCGKRIQL